MIFSKLCCLFKVVLLNFKVFILKYYIFRFIGTSGQNIHDLDKYSEATEKVEFVERTLRWRHLAPTAPNTLGNDYFTDIHYLATCISNAFV